MKIKKLIENHVKIAEAFSDGNIREARNLCDELFCSQVSEKEWEDHAKEMAALWYEKEQNPYNHLYSGASPYYGIDWMMPENIKPQIDTEENTSMTDRGMLNRMSSRVVLLLEFIFLNKSGKHLNSMAKYYLEELGELVKAKNDVDKTMVDLYLSEIKAPQ